MYLEHNETLGENLSADDFGKRLWGDCYLDLSSKLFKTTVQYATANQSKEVQSNGRLSHMSLDHCTKSTRLVWVSDNQLRINYCAVSVSCCPKSSSVPVLARCCVRHFPSFCKRVRYMLVQDVPHSGAAAAGKQARCYYMYIIHIYILKAKM